MYTNNIRHTFNLASAKPKTTLISLRPRQLPLAYQRRHKEQTHFIAQIGQQVDLCTKAAPIASTSLTNTHSRK
jgi:hypothetical protein